MPLTFSDRVRRALKKEPLNIKHLKKLASMEEGSKIIAIAIFQECSVETIRVLIKEGCGDVNGEYFYMPLEMAWEKHCYDNNIFEVLIESGGVSELSISKLDYSDIFYDTYNDRSMKKIIIILRYFPEQIVFLLKSSIKFIQSVNNANNYNVNYVRKTFDTKQIELLEFLFEKGFQFYSSRLIDNNPREPLENIFNDIKIVNKNSNWVFPIELDLCMKKFSCLMNFRKNIMPKFHLLYKIRMVYHTNFVKEHFYKKDCSSIDHLYTPLQNRIHQLPEVKYQVEGLSAYPGGEMEKGIGMNSKMIFQQEIIYQVANMKTDLFRELGTYLMPDIVDITTCF